MTRDEAVKAFEGIENPGSFGAQAWIDRFVALGILDIEESDTERRAAEEIFRTFKRLGPYCSSSDIMGTLSSAGFKIVKK